MTTAMQRTEPSPAPVVPEDGPWRHVAAPRRKPVHRALGRMLFRQAVARLPVLIEEPDGTIHGGGTPSDPRLRIASDDFYDRLGADGALGFGEAYLVRDWDTTADLADLLRPFAARTARHLPGWTERLRRLYVPRQPADEQNTRAGARRNIHRHYDLSNELFRLFLDESMTYSSALFAPGDRLEDAQHRKIDRLLDVTGVTAGTRVLEIGTGWGELAIRAARRGADVRTITLSREQQTLARRRASDAGVGDRIDVALCDYRDVEGSYDAIVSVEMIEAVGDRYWASFFLAVDAVLAPGGTVGIQAITQPHERFLATRGEQTWINRYIFPGGVLVSVPAVAEILRDETSLQIVEELRFGQSYAATLREWRARFTAHATEVEALGFDASFRRMWEFYLAFCEAGFSTGHLDVAQLVLRRR